MASLVTRRAAIAAPGATPRVVAVKHQRDMLEVILEKHLLPLRKRASH